MNRVFIINTHHTYDFSPGNLNAAFVKRTKDFFESRAAEVRVTESQKFFDVAEEIEKHQWADLIILQIPVNWMGVPWSFKKYMDEVYSAGLEGALCNGDGRTSKNPKTGYGSGGTLVGKKYMLSLTYNAPEEAFNDKNEYLLQGKTIDDMFLPQHLNFRFLGMTGLPTFAAYDVMKNPEIESDFVRFDNHLRNVFVTQELATAS